MSAVEVAGMKAFVDEQETLEIGGHEVVIRGVPFEVLNEARDVWVFDVSKWERKVAALGPLPAAPVEPQDGAELLETPEEDIPEESPEAVVRRAYSRYDKATIVNYGCLKVAGKDRPEKGWDKSLTEAMFNAIYLEVAKRNILTDAEGNELPKLMPKEGGAS